MKKCSVIFSYRDREEHAKINLPIIRKFFGDAVEIILVQQADEKPFRRGNLLNEGFRVARPESELVIFSDIDYVPTSDVVYYEEGYDCYLPVGFVDFVQNDFQPRPLDEIPRGYVHFSKGCDSRMGITPGEEIFFGGVETFTREAFTKINGYSSKFVGFGLEDADLRERVNYYGLKWKRGPGHFQALSHKDSGPPPNDVNFNNNLRIAHEWRFYLPHGVDNQPSKSEIVSPPDWANGLVDKWVKATDFDPPAPPTHIIASSFNFDEGDE